MAVPYSVIAIILSALLCPFAFRIAGWLIKRHTSARRELLLLRARELASKDVTSSVDDDWEKVDTVIGTAPNGDRPDKDWNGIVGFFHPFW